MKNIAGDKKKIRGKQSFVQNFAPLPLLPPPPPSSPPPQPCLLYSPRVQILLRDLVLQTTPESDSRRLQLNQLEELQGRHRAVCLYGNLLAS